jgi:hypothetical protein
MDSGAHLLGIEKLSALGGSEAFFDLGGDLGMVIREPLFLLMQHLNGLLDEFIRGRMGAALHVLLDQGFQLRLEMNRHTFFTALETDFLATHSGPDLARSVLLTASPFNSTPRMEPLANRTS